MGKFIDLALHPLELRAAIQLKFFRTSIEGRDPSKESSNLKRCYELLKVTSRSFAAVIQELHPELRNSVMVFYLVLRALDTIEDDMSIEKDVKVPLLRQFDSKLLTKDWTFDGNAITEKDRVVLVEFDKILTEYHLLKSEYQDVIRDITKQMGNGMADYIENSDFNQNGLQTIGDYDLYCHYVAGLVGDGLTRLIVLAKFGDSKLYEDLSLLESMGLFLQKTNIIRDYEEDQMDGRAFWPREIWGNYTDSLPNFLKKENQQQGLYCISELVANSLDHVIDVLKYLSLVEEQTCFNFTAIPQVMAIATLDLVYQNPEVFQRNVKIRKGTTCHLILEARTMSGVVSVFRHYIRSIHHKSDPRDPNYLRIGQTVGKIEQFIEQMYPRVPIGVIPETTEIRQQVLKRQPLDSKMEALAKKEEIKATLVLGSVLTVVLFVLYQGYTFCS
ncbi:CYFA0S36e00188g1_1 [Cyberlindnera fabianii]|uniref:Squalene synthase n=1 Tax=Cyberlindnera fabianii TaxID=36022 RepID=A0A061BCI6_CYBFA|nr:CYFA0S36e00188g1_1 [Cyberlindnera fabianii]